MSAGRAQALEIIHETVNPFMIVGYSSGLKIAQYLRNKRTKHDTIFLNEKCCNLPNMSIKMRA